MFYVSVKCSCRLVSGLGLFFWTHVGSGVSSYRRTERVLGDHFIFIVACTERYNGIPKGYTENTDTYDIPVYRMDI